MSKLDEELSALATMSPARLRAEWCRVCRSVPPDVSTDILARGIASRLHERRDGGMPVVVARELNRLARRIERTGSIEQGDQISLKPGTLLVREWGGRTCPVLVCEEGFLFEDHHFGSLSHVAREITGTNWSGPRFFGLKKRRPPKCSQHHTENQDG